ncbi:histidine phosphatase family protein [Xylophilus sp.]|uniref:histidine phosphatase family protein n=1 Tax=Xylophilus sp. TaxID=2653893 RepID=UPI0013B891C0|nr:histidine phosphatase family protein [Xylophilus sp.]KAF1049810.1 MAG: hypothetical protein GAK38_00473 [Xylophilus sp.]
MTARLWLVRHALPQVAPGICYGAQDVAADSAATSEAADRLHALLPAAAQLVTSPRRRCTALADALHARRGGAMPRVDARLAEMDFGRWEGRAWNAIAAAELRAWTDDFAGYRAGGHGESAGAFMARVGAAFDESTGAAGDVAWITHAGVIRAAMLIAQGIRTLARADWWPMQAPPFGQHIVLELQRD